MFKPRSRSEDASTLNDSRRGFLRVATAAAGIGAAGLPGRSSAAECGKSVLQAVKEAAAISAGDRGNPEC